jgi:phage shock protein C
VTVIRNGLLRIGLVRPRRGRLIGGVCAGVGRALDTSPWMIRLLAMVSIVLPGPQILLYVLLWIFMPEE